MKILPILLILLLLHIIPASAAVTADEITSNLKCQCGCTMIVRDCNCQEAEDIRTDVNTMVQQGMGKKQIIKELKSIYGNEILATPDKTGFDLSLWILPGVGAIIGGLLIYYIISKNKMSEADIFEMEYQEFLESGSEKGDDEHEE
ncbi:MAG: hypothetical protein E4G94_00445 [ANME-2 cluster archaeon]|nr:MAG: hypothetical protein E4G94_00445 [ANME-2 cluster archaeon]